MFDIAWSELLVIMVVALVVIGPRDLPKAMRVAGQWVRKARGLAAQFQGTMDAMVREAEMEEMRAELKKARTEIAQFSSDPGRIDDPAPRSAPPQSTPTGAAAEEAPAALAAPEETPSILPPRAAAPDPAPAVPPPATGERTP